VDAQRAPSGCIGTGPIGVNRSGRRGPKNAYEECVALELHTALGALGEIIGETATEDLLGEIFKNFCVGK